MMRVIGLPALAIEAIPRWIGQGWPFEPASPTVHCMALDVVDKQQVWWDAESCSQALRLLQSPKFSFASRAFDREARVERRERREFAKPLRREIACSRHWLGLET